MLGLLIHFLNVSLLLEQTSPSLQKLVVPVPLLVVEH